MSYIGQTINTFYDRYWKGRWWNSCNWTLGRAVSKLGTEAFDVEILEWDIRTDEELDKLERYYICLYQSVYPSGFNLEDGGEHRGAKWNDATRKTMITARRKAVAKNYVLFDEKGQKHHFKNLVEFAERHGIAAQHVFKLVHGQSKTSHGFALSVEAFSAPRRGMPVRVFLGPDGAEHEVANLLGFCRENDLSYDCMHRVGKGLNINHRGYRLKGGRAQKTSKNRASRYSKVLLEKDGKEIEVPLESWASFAEKHGFDKNRLYSQGIPKGGRVAGFKFLAIYHNNGSIIRHP